VNGSVRSIADRLAATVWVLALKMQLLQKCGLGLICLFESGFGGGSMPQGRHYLAAIFDFYGAFGTAVHDQGAFDLHLWHRRSPDPCRPWPQGWQRLLAG